MGSLFLIACQTKEIVKIDCGQTDWYEIGRRDGVIGLQPQISKLESTCGQHLNELKSALYSNGYNNGLNEYCSSENGFALGRANTKVNNICPKPLDQNFLKSYKKGLEVGKMDQENIHIDRQISSLTQKIKTTTPDKVHTENMQIELQKLKKKREANGKQITELTH
ncbi:MAG: DUF2799 domain-containing protein [Bdellovibrionales bacterium]|nr:DUF2799 domain-containing protein [Bdellovibrionales bacterium]